MKQVKSSTSKSIRDQIFEATLASLLSAVLEQTPKEILIGLPDFLNDTYSKLKNPILGSLMKADPVEKRDKIWNANAKRIMNVMQPLSKTLSAKQETIIQVSPENSSPIEPLKVLNHAIKAYQKKHEQTSCQADQISLGSRHKFQAERRIYWPKPLEINFLQVRDADDVATISCRVGSEIIPYAMIDSGSDSSVVSENVAKHLGLKIDRKKIHNLNGVASKSLSLGTIDNLPVTISDGKESATIMDEFSVIPTEKDATGKELSTFILGTVWQLRAGWEPLVKGEFKAICDGKTISIPLSVHKAQRNIFTVEKDLKPIKKKDLTDRTCQYCKKVFRYPANLRQHFLRKNQCAVEESHVKPTQSLTNPCTVEKSHVKTMQSLTNPCLEKNMVSIRLISA
jgi:hypothetical protein